MNSKMCSIKKSRFSTDATQQPILSPISLMKKTIQIKTQKSLPLKRTNTSLMLPKIPQTSRFSVRDLSSHNLRTTKNEQSETPLLGSPQTHAILLDLEQLRCHEYQLTGIQQGTDKKKINQDSLIQAQFPGFHLYAVCDGHGQFGHMVSKYVAEQIKKNLETGMQRNQYMLQYNTKLHKTVIQQAFQATSQSLNISNIPIQRSGSTCNLVILVQQNVINGIVMDLHQEFDKETVLYCANVGDSRALLVSASPRGGVSTTQLSFDHKPDIPEERARIIAKGGCIDNYYDESGEKVGPPRVWLPQKAGLGLAMSRSFGDSLGQSVGIIAEPTIMEYHIRENDLYIVIASDGLWDCLTNKEVASIVTEHQGKNVCRILVEAAQERWLQSGYPQDDISCQVIDLENGLF